MEKIEWKWDGEATEAQFERMEQFKNEFELIFPDLTVELIGTRPKKKPEE